MCSTYYWTFSARNRGNHVNETQKNTLEYAQSVLCGNRKQREILVSLIQKIFFQLTISMVKVKQWYDDEKLILAEKISISKTYIIITR